MIQEKELISGLSTKEAERRIEQFGLNELQHKEKTSVMKIFLSQFNDFIVWVLIAATIISGIIGDKADALTILIIVIINAILGFVQEFRTEKSLEALKELAAPTCKVLRDSSIKIINSIYLTIGDIVILEAGDRIPADGDFVESSGLVIDESLLTGESVGVNKESHSKNSTGFMGTTIVKGKGILKVNSIGMKTEMGKIAHLLQNIEEEKSPLNQRLDSLGKVLVVICLVICAMVTVMGIIRGNDITEMFLLGVSLAVAAIPEGLAAIVTVALALGVSRMLKRNALVRKLPAVETLGCTSVICSDKTGTLTQNKMTVKKIFVDNKTIDSENININDELESFLLNSSILCSDAVSVDGNEIGDPTEVALTNLGHKFSINEIECRKTYPRLREIPFDSDRKLMSTLHNINGKYLMITKGALDVLLERTVNIKTSSGIRKFTKEDADNINAANKNLSTQGLRVLAFAYKETAEDKELNLDDENDFTFLGLISMIDPPREESKAAVADCIKASIKPIMITGDHKITASAIAKEIGILQKDDIAMEGLELDKMSEDELNASLEHISVYARVSPEHKIRIVKAWQNKGKIVAMTGDGVNDAPALKQADIGIAMGITGTEVSKDAASMILTDDNFATIVKSITNGRNIYSNIKNSIKFLLSGNMSGILSVLYASIFALPAPFAPVHLLFINLITDSLPAIAIGMEKSKKDVLKDKPRNAKESILTKDFIISITLQGLVIGLFTMIAYHIGLSKGSVGTAMTMAFATLCIARLFHGFNCRGKKSIFSIGLFSNRFSWMAFGIGIVLVNAVLLVPGLQGLFEVTPLALNDIVTIHVLAFMPTVAIQLTKLIREFVEKRK